MALTRLQVWPVVVSKQGEQEAGFRSLQLPPLPPPLPLLLPPPLLQMQLDYETENLLLSLPQLPSQPDLLLQSEQTFQVGAAGKGKTGT